MSFSLSHLLGICLFSSVIFAAEKHTTVEITKSKDQVFIFKVVPNSKDLVINDGPDSPWTLTLSNVKGITFENEKILTKDFDKTLPGFRVKGSSAKAPVHFHYKLIAFVCTNGPNKICYRDVLEADY